MFRCGRAIASLRSVCGYQAQAVAGGQAATARLPSSSPLLNHIDNKSKNLNSYFDQLFQHIAEKSSANFGCLQEFEE
jgi:hypothetical protein